MATAKMQPLTPPVADSIVDDNNADPANTLIATTASQAVLDILSKVDFPDQRQLQMLCMYYGLSTGEPATSAEIGKAMGISSNRVSALVRGALTALQQSPYANDLRALLTDE